MHGKKKSHFVINIFFILLLREGPTKLHEGKIVLQKIFGDTGIKSLEMWGDIYMAWSWVEYKKQLWYLKLQS